MANITLDIAGHSYPVTCRDGEQEHIYALAQMIDDKVRQASSGGAMTEVRGLLFAALFLADALTEKQNQSASSANGQAAPAVPEDAVAKLHNLAQRVEALSETLEKGSTSP